MDKRIHFHRQVRELKKKTGELYGQMRNEYFRAKLGDIYNDLKELEQSIDLHIEDMNQMYLRNSAFPGDMVGWLDDDFTYDDDDDDAEDDANERGEK